MPIKQTKIWRLFSSVKLAISLIAIIVLLSLIGTLIPQNQDKAFYIGRFGGPGYQALLNTGLTDIYSSWYFILFLILFSANLTVCLLNSFFKKSRSPGSFISHVSVLVILLGALTGMLYGQRGYLEINKGESAGSFVSRDKPVNLGFFVRLDDFIYTENIDPKEKLLVYCAKQGDYCKMNEAPGADKKEGAIAQIPIDIGKESEIGDTGNKVRILRYVPDFVMDTATKEITSRSGKPNNPAVEVEVRDKAGKVMTSWVFARYPDMHTQADTDYKFIYNWAMRRPKDFISKVTIVKDGKDVQSSDILVNKPLHFSGYGFFQSSYDNEALAWSGLKIVKDPGVPLIYLGFILLMLGLATTFYVDPLMRRR